MFTETKLTEDQVKVARTFTEAFESLGRILCKVEKMYEDDPQALATAFAAEANILDSKIAVAIKGIESGPGDG